MAVYQPRLIEPSNTNMWTELGRQATGFGAALRDMDSEKRARERQAELDERDQNRYLTTLEMTPGVSRVAPGTASHGIQRDSLLPAPTLSADGSVLTGESPAGGRLSQAHLPGLGDAIRAPEGMTSLSGAPGLAFDPQWRQKEEEAAFGRTQEREAAERARVAAAFEAARSGGSVGQYIAEGGSPQDLVERPMTLDDQVAHQSRLNMLPRWESPLPPPSEARIQESLDRERVLDEARGTAMMLLGGGMSQGMGDERSGPMTPARVAQILQGRYNISQGDAQRIAVETANEQRRVDLQAANTSSIMENRSGGGSPFSLESLLAEETGAPPERPSVPVNREQQAAWDRAAEALRARGENPEERLGPRP